jgi:hypothetical protein
MKRREWSAKVQSGDWVAFKSGTREDVVAVGRTLDSTVRKVAALGKQNEVVYSQVPPQHCSLIL